MRIEYTARKEGSSGNETRNRRTNVRMKKKWDTEN
jgi:hypothetical protein